MISKVVVPNLGATGGDVILVEWLVGEGDFVQAAAPLFVVETDKALDEVQAFRDGYLRRILVPIGSTVELGTVVALLADTLEEPIGEMPAAPLAQRQANVIAEGTCSTMPEPTAAIGPPQAPGETTESTKRGRPLASPQARRVAREKGINLHAVQGSGAKGEIHLRDVLRTAPAAIFAPRGGPPTPAARRVPLSPMRRAIARHTQRSKTEIPHFYVTTTIDMTEAHALCQRADAAADQHGQVAPTLTDLAIRAAALALRRAPQLNVSFQGEEMLYFDEIHIGLVVALDDGMAVPVIGHADQLDLHAIAATTRRLREKAVAGKLSLAEMSGSTLTLSNLGMYGVDSFIAVIHAPEAAILALGAARLAPAVWQGQIVPRPLMTATLSADHRAVDGVTAARFLAAFKDLMENPH